MVAVYNYAKTCDKFPAWSDEEALCLDGSFLKENKSYLFAPEKAYIVEFYDKKIKFPLLYEQAKNEIQDGQN